MYGDAYPLGPETDLWRLFAKNLPTRTYEKDQMIYWQEEQADCFYCIKKGRVKVFLSSENGMEKTITIVEQGILGEAAFFDHMPRVSSAKALVKTELIAINRNGLIKSFSQDPDLAVHLLELMAHRVRLLSEQVDNMTFLQADQRVAQALLRHAVPGEDGILQVNLTHEEIANLAGTTRVTVSKLLTRFAKNGWIGTRYRAVALKNPAALRSFSKVTPAGPDGFEKKSPGFTGAFPSNEAQTGKDGVRVKRAPSDKVQAGKNSCFYRSDKGVYSRTS